jgi:hypothetical protein
MVRWMTRHSCAPRTTAHGTSWPSRFRQNASIRATGSYCAISDPQRTFGQKTRTFQPATFAPCDAWHFRHWDAFSLSNLIWVNDDRAEGICDFAVKVLRKTTVAWSAWHVASAGHGRRRNRSPHGWRRVGGRNSSDRSRCRGACESKIGFQPGASLSVDRAQHRRQRSLSLFHLPLSRTKVPLWKPYAAGRFHGVSVARTDVGTNAPADCRLHRRHLACRDLHRHCCHTRRVKRQVGAGGTRASGDVDGTVLPRDNLD